MTLPNHSQSSSEFAERTQVTVIINPVSCGGNFEFAQSEIARCFLQYGVKAAFQPTSKTYPTSKIAATALQNGAELLVAAGGDGTIMEIVNALVNTTVPLGIIPLGTGNLFAINLGIPASIEQAIDIIMTGRQRPIDLVRVNDGDHCFAIMGGIGFDARIMDSTDRLSKQRFGRLAYIWTAIQNLEGALFDADLWLDDGPMMTEPVKSILIANMGFIGPNFSLFHSAQPDDGLLRIGLLKASTTQEFLRLVTRTVTEGTPEPDPSFDVFTCRNIRIRLAEAQPYEYDGEIQGTVTHLYAEIMPGALILMSAAI